MAHKHMKNMPKEMRKDMPHYDEKGGMPKGMDKMAEKKHPPARKKK